MAVSEEPQSTVEAKPEPQPWRPGEPVLVEPPLGHRSAPTKAAPAVWLKSLVDLFHRRAPA